MKQIITLIFILSLSNIISAQTNISGNQSGTWNFADSPFLVTDHITIPAGQILNIEPGVEVRFQGYYKFNVFGSLQALGTENATILFTAENQTTGWGGLRISTSDLINLKYCRIEYGFSSGEYPDIHGGGMAVFGSSVNVENCIFADNSTDTNGMGGAVYVNGTSSSSFINTTFTRNNAYGEGGAMKFTGGDNITISNSNFIQNYCSYGGGAISFYATFGAMIKGSIFVDNYTTFAGGGAVHTLGFGNQLFFVNNTITNNHAVTGDGGAIVLNYANAYFVNNIVYQNPGLFSDDIFIGPASIVEIYYSNLPMPTGATGNNNINQDPLFVDIANYDFSLSENSPNIDNGIAYLEAGGTTLVDMNPAQYYGNAPDIGAVEYIPDLIFINGFE
ncbi:MAG: right-handed parallel beta-helix repeat-containing protein [Proteobacteria bacterium]|nr:right-handed parallel beta-helix repeat-containing protein [Pseudomonadota bacterium]